MVAEPLARPEPPETARATAPARRRAALELLARSGSPLAVRVRTVRDLQAAAAPREPAAWSAALPTVAALFPTGLPRGELVELVGRRSAGRFGLCLELIAAATAAGENAALVDLGDGLDPAGADAAGIELPRLLWARPRDSRQALAAAEALVGGGLPLVVIDLGLPPVPGGRGVEGHWVRLARAARDAGSLLFLSAPYRTAGVAAAVALELRAARGRWLGAEPEPRLLDGVHAHLEALKPHLDRDRTPSPILRLAVS